MNEKDLKMLNQIIYEECLKCSWIDAQSVHEIKKNVCRRLYGMSRTVEMQKGSGETRSEVYPKVLSFDEWWDLKTTKNDFNVEDVFVINDIYHNVFDTLVRHGVNL